ALACLALFLVVFTLAVGKPGLPMTFKADEPAYYLMAQSLAHDRDLQCDSGDLGRLFDEFPYLATFNLILMTDDGWQTTFFGKPYIYSLVAAPLVGVFGANGMVALNMLLLMAMIWMGSTYLSRFNPAPLAALFSVGFFLLSTAFAYVFWLHPEIFNMAGVMGCLYFALHPVDPPEFVSGRCRALRRWLARPGARASLSAALLALAAYNKPMLAAVALGPLVSWAIGRQWRNIVIFAATGLVIVTMVGGLSVALTGHPSAYLGVERMGVPVFDPSQMPVQPVRRPPAAEEQTTNSWYWLLRVPDINVSELRLNLGYFLWGRHTGLLPYLPFAALSLLLFLFHRGKTAVRWSILISLVGVAAFFLIWIPFNWHGGGGFVGNRYFVNVYPAFLFLVTSISPTWLIGLTYAVGGLFLGPILFTPFGAPVPEPTLQAHVRNPPFRLLPLELTFRRKLPGYDGTVVSGLWIQGRRDVFKAKDDGLWIHGATPVELWVYSSEKLDGGFTLWVRSLAPDNEVRLKFAGTTQSVFFTAEPPTESNQRVRFEPQGPDKVLHDPLEGTIYAYRLLVETRTGFVPNAARNAETKFPVNDFYLGAELQILGTDQNLARDLYQLQWGESLVPDTAVAGEEFEVLTRLKNSSGQRWPSSGPTRVNLSYHWLRPDGETVSWEGQRTPLGADLESGGELELVQAVTAPEVPGRYYLQLDLVRERVAWFSDKNDGNTLQLSVEILPAPATEDSPEP
ncbi:MAG: hypothetical protein WBP34_10945, partial [Thermoanaerobaculia bacterium]